MNMAIISHFLDVYVATLNYSSDSYEGDEDYTPLNLGLDFGPRVAEAYFLLRSCNTSQLPVIQGWG